MSNLVCRCLARHQPWSQGPLSFSSHHVWPTLGRIRSVLVKSGRDWGNVGRCSANVDQMLAEVGRSWGNLTELGRSWVEVWPTVSRSWSKFGSRWSNFLESGQILTQILPSSTNVGHCLSDLADFGATLGNIWQTSAKVGCHRC